MPHAIFCEKARDFKTAAHQYNLSAQFVEKGPVPVEMNEHLSDLLQYLVDHEAISEFRKPS